MFKTIRRGVKVFEENYATCIRWVCMIDPGYIKKLEVGEGIADLVCSGGEISLQAEAWRNKLIGMSEALGLTLEEIKKIDKQIRKKTLNEIREKPKLKRR